jgi:hypothetical protein
LWSSEEQAARQALQTDDSFVDLSGFPQVGNVVVKLLLVVVRVNLKKLQQSREISQLILYRRPGDNPSALGIQGAESLGHL